MIRAVQEFAIHFESFRNIDVWYQGAYLLAFQLYAEGPKPSQVHQSIKRESMLIPLLLPSIITKGILTQYCTTHK